MANDVLVGIDLGTTVLKVGAFRSNDGKCICHSLCRLRVRHLPEGGCELEAASIDAAVNQTLGKLRRGLGSQWRYVSGIGVAAQGGSTLIVERETGRPVSVMYLWNDARAYGWVSRLSARMDKKFWQRMFLFDMPPTGLGRLAWLQEQRSDLFRDEYLHIGAGEYLFHRLTGIWRQDSGNAIQIGSYNARKRKLDGRALELIGVPLSFVAPLRIGHEVGALSKGAAGSFKILEGIPVAGPYIDQEASYLAALGALSRPLQCSLGTAWVGNFSLPGGVRGRSPSQIVLAPLRGDGSFVVQPLYTGNAAWDWALETFCDRDHAQALKRAAAIFAKRMVPGCGVVCIPWHTQQNPLSPDSYGAGMFLGVGTHTTKADLLRATAAGLVFELARMFARLESSGVVDGVVLGGGASRGAYFRKMTALAFPRLPLLWQEDYNMAAARGALFAISERAAKGKFIPVPPPAGLAGEFERFQRLYEKAFERVHGQDPNTQPYLCG